MENKKRTNLESGLFCVGVISRYNGTQVGSEQLLHYFGNRKGWYEPVEIARILKSLGLHVKITDRDVGSLKDALFPVIAHLKSGEYVIVAKLDRENRKILIQKCTENRAVWHDLDSFAANISRRLIILKKKSVRDGSERSFGLKWFFLKAGRYRKILTDCIIASLFVQIFALAAPLVFMIVIDKVLGNNSMSTLDVLVFALVVVSAFEIVLNAVRSYLLSHTANRIDLMLGVELFKHLIRLPLSFFESRRVGETIARIKELDTVRHFITGSGLMLFIDIFFLVIFLAVMMMFSPFLTAIVLTAMPFLFGASFFLTPLLRDRLEDKYASGSENHSFLVETISGIETVKSTAAEPRVQEAWEDRLTGHVKSGFKSGHYANMISQATTVVSKVLSVLLLWFGAKEVLKGNLTVGQLIAFNMLSSRVIAPIIRLSQIWKELQQVRISVARIGDIFNCPREPGFDPDRVSLPEIKGNIEFEQVTFRYNPAGREILEDISFSVSAGEVVGIVGSTGSGKTTLLKLLQRLYVPERGRILVDGTDISVVDSSWLRRQIGVVSQDGVLFNGSIRENIAFTSPTVAIEEVVRAAELAGIHEFVIGMPYGYDTQVGERGLQLSAGQRQRIAIARALVSNPKMLILDEATSALDYESELIIQKNMKRMCAGRTVFIIAHRLSTVRHADRIITLDGGKIVENDNPRALLASDGRYASLHSIQESGYVY